MTEIVAPAGNFEKLKTAILYGAKTVYLAGQKYSLRMGSDNFSESELQQASFYCQSQGCKIYVTLNAYLYDQDFNGFVDYLKFLEKIKISAAICSDLGVVSLVKQHTKIPVHLSTQAFVLNSYHAQLWKNLGVKRIVVGRELTVKQSATIKQQTGIEVEQFIHGAMCMSYSGHCTISNYTAGRDSNRGGCIQSCRHIYNLKTDNKEVGKQTLLSSKDLLGINYLKNFVKLGIDAAKIEGRMKGELYLAVTIKAYTRALKELKENKNYKQGLNFYKGLLTEFKKTPHRDYTTASLFNKARGNSIYEGINPQKEKLYQFLGMVIFYDIKHKRVFLKLKNKIYQGAEIEILGLEDNLLLEVKQLENAIGENIEISQANSVVSFDCPEVVKLGLVARWKQVEFTTSLVKGKIFEKN